MELLFLDTETGGLKPVEHALLQVGAVAQVDGIIVDSIEFNLTFDESDYAVTPKALEVNGIDLASHQSTAISPSAGVILLNQFIAKNFKAKPTLVGHNPSIDKYMVALQLYEANDLSMDDYIGHRMIDTMSILWGLYLGGKVPIEACSSTGAFKYFHIQVNGRHTALGDSLATAELLGKLVEMLK
jgi:DNA polymerase-3 subunit epsilon